jgi:sugar transferase (PEP-CTERM system associated)
MAFVVADHFFRGPFRGVGVQSDQQMAGDGSIASRAHGPRKWSVGNPMIRLFHVYVPSSLMVLFLVDSAILYISISLGMVYSYASVSDLIRETGSLEIQRMLFLVVVMLSLFTMGLHHRRYIAELKMVPLRLAAAHLMAFILLTLAFYFVPNTRIWLSALIPALLISMFSLLVSRVVFVKAAKVSFFRQPVLIFGAGAQARRIEMAEARGRIRCVGFVAPEGSDIAVSPDRVVASRGSLSDLAKRYGATEIVVGLEERRGRLPTDELLTCRLQGVWVRDFTSFMERETGQVELQSLDPSWLIFSDGFSAQHRIERAIKRVFDVVVSSLLLMFAVPVALATALAIHFEDGGPIFYRQRRVGLQGHPFMLLKFRSMKVDAEGDGVARWASADDSRITKVGAFIRKTRIDEIPQVINVLKGEMSFVGPRPEQVAIVEELSREVPYYRYRHMVKPGITGWAQINYPYGASIEDALQKLKFELYYIKNYSLILDFLILIQTVRVVLWPQGAR